MISTVTTTTITTIMTSTTGLAASLMLLAVLALLFFLIQKEILSAATSARARAMGKVLNIAIVPLVLSFIFIVVVKVASVLN
jgi:hypothetical protein